MSRIIKIFILIFLAFSPSLFFIGCHKATQTYEANASVMGTDMRMCVCCGGYFILFDGQQINNLYLASAFPEGFKLEENPKFPIRAYIEWKKDSSSCSSLNRIIISKIIITN